MDLRLARSAFCTNFASKSERQNTMENSIRVWREHPALLAAHFEVSAYAGRLQPDMPPIEISRANLERMTHAVMDLDSFAALNETAPA